MADRTARLHLTRRSWPARCLLGERPLLAASSLGQDGGEHGAVALRRHAGQLGPRSKPLSSCSRAVHLSHDNPRQDARQALAPSWVCASFRAPPMARWA
eukprot:scaffold188_cov429-Prasinococcus_capsulatus_cf.AAC.16